MLPSGLLFTMGWLLQQCTSPLLQILRTVRHVPLTFLSIVWQGAAHFGHLARSSSKEDSKIKNFLSKMWSFMAALFSWSSGLAQDVLVWWSFMAALLSLSSGLAQDVLVWWSLEVRFEKHAKDCRITSLLKWSRMLAYNAKQRFA